jgi:hypothetical protein
MYLEESWVRRCVLLACGRREGQRQEGSRSPKGPRISEGSKALKAGIPGATRSEMAGRLEGEQGVKRGSNSEDATCWALGTQLTDPSSWRSLKGTKPHERDSAETGRSDHADARGAGVNSGNTL